MKSIIEYLKAAKESKSHINVFNVYTDKLYEKIKKEEIKIIEKEVDPIIKSRLYKIATCNKFNKKISLDDAFWIINIWGGIGSFKRNERNEKKIISFLDKLENGLPKMIKNEFETISSLSKISFFYDIEKYSIYDSRVIYSLNWILYKTKTHGIKYFPMPNGRNRIIANYPIDALIKFSLLEKGEEDFSKVYYSYKEAYREYNKLMAEISSEIYGLNSKPFFAEMLLFGIADNYIFQDIKSELNITLKNWS